MLLPLSCHLVLSIQVVLYDHVEHAQAHDLHSVLNDRCLVLKSIVNLLCDPWAYPLVNSFLPDFIELALRCAVTS